MFGAVALGVRVQRCGLATGLIRGDRREALRVVQRRERPKQRFVGFAIVNSNLLRHVQARAIHLDRRLDRPEGLVVQGVVPTIPGEQLGLRHVEQRGRLAPAPTSSQGDLAPQSAIVHETSGGHMTTGTSNLACVAFVSQSVDRAIIVTVQELAGEDRFEEQLLAEGRSIRPIREAIAHVRGRSGQTRRGETRQ